MMGIKFEAVLLFRKFITSRTLPQTIRYLHSEKVPDDITDKKSKSSSEDNVKKIKKRSAKDTKEMCKYFKYSNFNEMLDKLPGRVVTSRKTKPEHLYLLDDNAADIIIDLIKDDLINDPYKVVEVNPGVGILTEKLLSAGIPTVTLMEPCIKLIQYLASLQTIYDDRIIIREADLLNVWKIAYKDKQDDGNRMATLFNDFPHLKWGEEIGLRIIGAATSPTFIKHMMMDIVRQCGLVSYGRPCFYLSLPALLWKRLTCDNSAGYREYRASTVLFQLLFDYEMLGKIPRKSFLPWPPAKTGTYKGQSIHSGKLNCEDMCIVRIEGKKDLFTGVIDEEHIQQLWYFVNHHLVARTGRVIPLLEAWEPDCGPKLIRLGLNIFTQFGDLNPHEILNLFKEFSTWEGYQNTFIPSLQNSPQKMEQLLF